MATVESLYKGENLNRRDKERVSEAIKKIYEEKIANPNIKVWNGGVWVSAKEIIDELGWPTSSENIYHTIVKLLSHQGKTKKRCSSLVALLPGKVFIPCTKAYDNIRKKNFEAIGGRDLRRLLQGGSGAAIFICEKDHMLWFFYQHTIAKLVASSGVMTESIENHPQKNNVLKLLGSS